MSPYINRRRFLFAVAGVVALPACDASLDSAEAAAADQLPTGSTPTPSPIAAAPTPAPTTPAPTPTPTPPPATQPPATIESLPPDTPPPPPQPAWPASRPAEVGVATYENRIGVANANSPLQMFWQSAYTTKDGTLIEWGTGDHGPTSDNGVREFDPVTGTQSYVYPNNRGTLDQSQYDNFHYLYIQRLDSLVIPARGQYQRSSGRWLIGNLQSNGRSVAGTGADDLFRPVGYFNKEGYYGSYNAHQAWSAQHDCGVCISGGMGGDRTARRRMWIIVPSSGLGSYPQPYVIFERAMPATAGDASPSKINGRDGCCFAGDYVYWVGGEESNTTTASPHFFRMNIKAHLKATNATLMIERLPDAPAAFTMGLLRYDPYTNALLSISDKGIFVFDIATWSWADVTPQAYRADYAAAPTNGFLPRGCLGDFVESRSGQTLRKFVWRPGMNHSWDYDYGGTNTERMYNRFRAIKLARRS